MKVGGSIKGREEGDAIRVKEELREYWRCKEYQ